MIKIILMLVKFFIFSILPFILVLGVSNGDQTAGINNINNWITMQAGCDPTQAGCDLISSDVCIGCQMLESLFDNFARGADYALDFLLQFSIELMAILLVLWVVFYSYQTILKADETTLKDYLSKIVKRLLWAVLIAGILGAYTPNSPNLVKMSARIYMTPVMKLGNYVSQKILQVPSTVCDNYKSKTQLDDSVFSNEMKKDFLCYVSSTSLLVMGGMQGGGQLMSLGWSIKSFYTFISGYWVFLAFFSLSAYLLFLFLDVLLSFLIPLMVLPLLLVGYVFERTSGMLMSFAVKSIEKVVLFMISLSLSLVIVYAVYTHIGDRYFPAPIDNFSFIFPSYFTPNDSVEKSEAKKQYEQCLGIISNSNLRGDNWSFQLNTSSMNAQTLNCYKQLPTPETSMGLMALLMLIGLSKLTFKMLQFIQGKLGLGGSMPITGLGNLATNLSKTAIGKGRDFLDYGINFIGGKFKK